MKRLLVLLMVCALSASVPMTALAASAPIDEGSGVWAISGKLTISASFANLLTLTLTLPNIAILQEEFGFDSDNNLFSDDYLISEDDGVEYSETSKGYTVNLTDWADGFAQGLADELSSLISDSYGIDTTIDVTSVKATFTGTATAKGKMTANISIVNQIADTDIGLSGKITITGTLTGVLETDTGARKKLAGVRQTPRSLAKALVAGWSRGLLFQKGLPALLGLPAK